MMKLIALISFFTTTFTFACADLSKKPAYLSAKKVECGSLLHRIHDPAFTIKGKTYPFGMNLGDLSGECPDPLRGCYTPYQNLKKRGNAICKAFGLGTYANMRDYGTFRRLPDLIVSLERNASGIFAPKVVSINHSRSEYAWAKTINCHRVYPKR